MLPEEVVGTVVLDAGAYPLLTPIVVVDLCFKGFAAGKDMLPAIFAVVAIASIGKELQGVLAMGRSSEIAQFLVKFDEGRKQGRCIVAQEPFIRVIRILAHLWPQAVVTCETGLVKQSLGIAVDATEAFKDVVNSHSKKSSLIVFHYHRGFRGRAQVRSCWREKKDIPGSVNLHELPRKSCQGWNGQWFFKGESEGKDTLFPVPPELADDVLDIVLINEEVPVHDVLRGDTVFHAIQDFLLVIKGDLGVWDQDIGDEGMGSFALFTPDTLDNETQKVGHKLYMAAVMPIADQTAGSSTGTFHHVQLQLIHCQIIRILREGVAIFKENRYHSLEVHARA